MNIQELQRVVGIKDRALSLGRGSLGAAFDALLVAAYREQTELRISDAALVEGGAADRVVIEGRSSFLNVPDVPLTATFFLDGAGQPQAILRYRFRDAVPAPSAWVFSRSFPDLPRTIDFARVPDYDGESAPPDPKAAEAVYLDSLDLFDTFFIAATTAGRDAATDAALVPGLNFVSRLRPAGALGVLAYSFDNTTVLSLRGRVNLPVATTPKPLALLGSDTPWNHPEAPGIHLEADLGLDAALGKMKFQQSRLRIYSPPSAAWQKENPTYRPLHGYTAKLAIPSANIEVDLSAGLRWNMPEALLRAACSGIRLGNIAQLLDVSDGASLAPHVPEPLQQAFAAVDQIELTEVGLALSAFGTPSLDAVILGIGTPNLKWKVWGDHLTVENLSLRFEIRQPFTKTTQVRTTLGGTVRVEGVPVAITAESADGFTSTRASAASRPSRSRN